MLEMLIFRKWVIWVEPALNVFRKPLKYFSSLSVTVSVIFETTQPYLKRLYSLYNSQVNISFSLRENIVIIIRILFFGKANAEMSTAAHISDFGRRSIVNTLKSSSVLFISMDSDFEFRNSKTSASEDSSDSYGCIFGLNRSTSRNFA